MICSLPFLLRIFKVDIHLHWNESILLETPLKIIGMLENEMGV